MPAKWQQWMPFRIDAFKGSPAVQAMHPCARIGYLYLLACAWQTEDCTVSSDQLELAEQSGLGDELWAVHGPRILRKFETVNGNDRLRNQVLFDEWNEAKRVFDARRNSAMRTTEIRSPRHKETVTVEESDGHRTVTVSRPSRSAHTRTTVVPVGVSVPVSVGVEPEMLAKELPKILGLAAGAGPGSLYDALYEVAKIESEAGRCLEDVAAEMEAAYHVYQEQKPKLRFQWGAAKFFGEGHWREKPNCWPRKEDRTSEREQRRKAFMEATID